MLSSDRNIFIVVFVIGLIMLGWQKWDDHQVRQEAQKVSMNYKAFYRPLVDHIDKVSPQTRVLIGERIMFAEPKSKELLVQAEFWFQAAISAGSRQGLVELAGLYRLHDYWFIDKFQTRENLKREVKRLYRKAAIRGHVESMYSMLNDFDYSLSNLGVPLSEFKKGGRYEKMGMELRTKAYAYLAWAKIGLGMSRLPGTESDYPENSQLLIAEEGCVITGEKSYCEWAQRQRKLSERYKAFYKKSKWDVDKAKSEYIKKDVAEAEAGLTIEERNIVNQHLHELRSQVIIDP